MLLFIQLLENNQTTITRNQNMFRLSIMADVSTMGSRNIWIARDRRNNWNYTQLSQMNIKPMYLFKIFY